MLGRRAFKLFWHPVWLDELWWSYCLLLHCKISWFLQGVAVQSLKTGGFVQSAFISDPSCLSFRKNERNGFSKIACNFSKIVKKTFLRFSCFCFSVVFFSYFAYFALVGVCATRPKTWSVSSPGTSVTFRNRTLRKRLSTENVWKRRCFLEIYDNVLHEMPHETDCLSPLFQQLWPSCISFITLVDVQLEGAWNWILRRLLPKVWNWISVDFGEMIADVFLCNLSGSERIAAGQCANLEARAFDAKQAEQIRPATENPVLDTHLRCRRAKLSQSEIEIITLYILILFHMLFMICLGEHLQRTSKRKS